MKNSKVLPIVFGGIAAVLVLFIGFFGLTIAINIKSQALWRLIILAILSFFLVFRIAGGHRDFVRKASKRRKKPQGFLSKADDFFDRVSINFKPYMAVVILIALLVVVKVSGSKALNAKKYASVLTVKTSAFKEDLSESLSTDSIALMDTQSARMLGDREIGSLSGVVSQFDVSDDYVQIDYQGKPIKVATLDYAGFFKWINNRKNGVAGYVSVDPVSMSASFHKTEGMKYVQSGWFLDDARRHIWLKYPTTIFKNLHFEIDESGKPYYVAAIYDYKVSLFGAPTVTGCIVMDPVSGDTVKYDLDSIPQWVDVVFDGELICRQYNWHGTLQKGFINSVFAKSGCKKVTSYDYDDDDVDDDMPESDYGYVSKDGDIWIYTGVTSVNGDSSNIGFLLANERTGESRYYEIAGADEKSAMASAEGEVQEKGYQASFPSLINVNGSPTYIMVLKDSGGLVKLYAAVNVEQYNLVATAPTQDQCFKKYKALLGIDETAPKADSVETKTVTIKDIKYITVDGNTYIYLIDKDDKIYKAKASENEEMLLLQAGDKIELQLDGSKIAGFQKVK